MVAPTEERTPPQDGTSAGPTKSPGFRAHHVLEVAGGLVMLAMTVHVVVNAVSRKLWSTPLKDTLEITEGWYMPVLALLGFVAAQRAGAQIAVDLLLDQAPAMVQRLVRGLVGIVTAVLLGALAFYTWEEARHAHEVELTVGFTSLEVWQVYYLVPICFAVLTLQVLWGSLKRDQSDNQTSATEELS